MDEYWLKSHYEHAECGAHDVPVLSFSVIYEVPGDVTGLVLYHRHQGHIRPQVNIPPKKETQIWCFKWVSGDDRISVIRWVKVDSHLHTLLKTQKAFQMCLVTLFWMLQKENMWSLNFYHPLLATLVIFSFAGLLRNQTDPWREGYSQTFGLFHAVMVHWCHGEQVQNKTLSVLPSTQLAAEWKQSLLAPFKMDEALLFSLDMKTSCLRECVWPKDGDVIHDVQSVPLWTQFILGLRFSCHFQFLLSSWAFTNSQ